LKAQASDERALIEQAKQDPSRFAALYESHFERVYAFAVRHVRGREEAEDLTAEVFHRALAALPNFEWRGLPFGAWLLRIASNAAADRFKHSEREATFYGLEDPPGAVEPADLEEIEQRASLFRLVDGLPVDQRRVIVMRFAEGKSIREISEELGRTEGAVKQLQFRALENLRTRMRETRG
jgi:RNA polymerase sigma-70 factor, ECF subfamily